MNIEFHFHTKETSPCGKVSASDGVKLYAELKYDGIVVTDHFSREVFGDEREWNEIVDDFLKGYYLALEAGKQENVKIYLGMEIRFSNSLNDFLVYGLTEKFLYDNPWVYESTIKEFFEIAQKNGLIVVQAHPFRNHCTPSNPQYLHGVEVYNANPRHNSHNDKAKLWAEEEGLIQTRGSDFHQVEDIQKEGMIIDTLPNDNKELVYIIRTMNGEFV